MRRFLLLLALFGPGCATALAETGKPPPKPPLPVFDLPPEPRDPAPTATLGSVVIHGATVMTAAGDIHQPGYIVLKDGLIAAVGTGDAPDPPGAQRVDAAGKFVTPGIIDTHSHMGVYALPFMEAHSDGNEAVGATTPHVWAEHSFWPQDPSLWRALAGGVTTIQVLPGSANLIGGRSYVAKIRPAPSARLMRFPGAPQGLKMACGENPKRVYGDKGGPQTRMGNVAGYRAAFQRALEYRRSWRRYERDLAHWHEYAQPKAEEDPPDPPTRDFGMETLVKVLDGEIWVHNHCYRADEMHIMLDLAAEFGFTIRSFHHALEAYKLRERLASEGVAASTWSDWYGFKMEAFDGVAQNAAMLTEAGARAIIHSDSETELRHLNQEAAKAMFSGRGVGIAITEDQALRWITANPAWALGIDAKVGTLEVGKMADLVIWDRSPFSVYALAQRVYVDGALAYDRAAGHRLSDFELGLNGTEVQP